MRVKHIHPEYMDKEEKTRRLREAATAASAAVARLRTAKDGRENK